MKASIQINLYSTAGCHLCEQVVLMLSYVKAQTKITGVEFNVCEIDIAESDELIEELGEKIPVLEASLDNFNQRLYWPFQFAELMEWVKDIKKER
ncbi:glutaredoxin family protein [Aliikangiella sp. IMCC44653]